MAELAASEREETSTEEQENISTLIADHSLQKTSTGTTITPSRLTRSRQLTRHLEAAPVAGVADGVGAVLVALVGVALLSVAEVAEAVDDCVGPADEVIAWSVGEELSLE
ncbi:MAG: hypothetical protein Q9195_003752 [Heterodermia aff. obscurata]